MALEAALASKEGAMATIEIATLDGEGRFNAYPLPGRTFLVKAGATF